MSAIELRTRAATTQEIARFWQQWGSPIVSLERLYEPTDVQGLVATDGADAPTALVTWCVEDTRAEIVTVQAAVRGQRLGRGLLRTVEELLATLGIGELWLITTNDNLDALRMYQQLGYRVHALHHDAMDRVRAHKPDVPELGVNGIPLRDVWELRKSL